jgi:hypothetical protein
MGQDQFVNDDPHFSRRRNTTKLNKMLGIATSKKPKIARYSLKTKILIAALLMIGVISV